MPLGHAGGGHHRIACAVPQRRKGPVLHPAPGAAFGPRTDCSPGQPDEIKPQPQPSLSFSLHFGSPLLSPAHFQLHNGLCRKVSIQINFCLRTEKSWDALHLSLGAFFFPRSCVSSLWLSPPAARSSFWVVCLATQEQSQADNKPQAHQTL